MYIIFIFIIIISVIIIIIIITVFVVTAAVVVAVVILIFAAIAVELVVPCKSYILPSNFPCSLLIIWSTMNVK